MHHPCPTTVGSAGIDPTSLRLRDRAHMMKEDVKVKACRQSDFKDARRHEVYKTQTDTSSRSREQSFDSRTPSRTEAFRDTGVSQRVRQ